MSNLIHGIGNLSIVPMRAEASDKSEMVSQLLFGELFTILEENEKWFKIETTHDKYQAWIDKKQCRLLPDLYYQKLLTSTRHYTKDVFQHIQCQSDYFPLVIGSVLPNFDGLCSNIANKKYTYSGDTVAFNAQNFSGSHIIENAVKFLNAPYLWGGRTPFGIDCSGFVQIVCRLVGVSLKRDAYQQAQQGTMVLSFDEVRKGDLIFFGREQGKITHVGIALGNNKIIHASGKVRIDKMDRKGIFNEETKKYTHQLRLIKRVLHTPEKRKQKTSFDDVWGENLVIHK